MSEWDSIWAWWTHEVWMELYIYDMLFEGAWITKHPIFQNEKEKHE